MSLTSFGNLFNTVADPNSTKLEIASANAAFKAEYITPQEIKADKIKECLSQGTVTQKIKGDGYNLTISRLENETNKAWSKRTESIAKTMNQASDGKISVAHKTFKSGRIIAQVQQNTANDSLFKQQVA